MIFSLKPFNGAEMRNYLDLMEQAPVADPAADEAAYQTWAKYERYIRTLQGDDEREMGTNTVAIVDDNIRAKIAQAKAEMAKIGTPEQQAAWTQRRAQARQREMNPGPSVKPIEESDELPGTKGDWRHGGHSVKYDPSSNTVHVKGKGGEEKHAFGKHPSHDNYRKRVQQIIDKLENDLTEADRMRDFIKLIS